jgi:hypothetical protein
MVVAEGDLSPVAAFITKGMGGDCRAVGDGDWDSLLLLPCTVEVPDPIMQDRYAMGSMRSLVRFLNFAKINLLVVSKFPAYTDFSRVANYLRGLGMPVIDAPAHFAVDLRTIAGQIPLPPIPVDRSRCAAWVFNRDLNPQITDLLSPANPRNMLYRDAPNWLTYFTNVRSILLQPDAAARYKLGPLRCLRRHPLESRRGTIEVAVGPRPEDSLRNANPLRFSIRVLSADGKQLGTGSWIVKPRDYQRVGINFDNTVDDPPAYVEIRSERTSQSKDPPMQLLVAELLIRWYGASTDGRRYIGL